jgi:hemolysin activation/secretion protein
LTGNWHGPNSTLNWGLALNANLFYSGSLSNLQGITGSPKSTGYWVTVNPNISWQFSIFTNWPITLRADGQMATEPLINVEQFSAGGVNSVRGYQEGEVFGDDGWHIGFEQLTPPHTVGMVGRWPLVIRGSIYMDYAHTYIVDPAKGETDGVALWGTGVGAVASLGPYWEARFLFSLPLLKTYNTDSEQPYFNFALTAQF